ncbi:MAG: glycosyltransferase family 4 protein [Bacteroidetes bacterium]|nr:glycosyltransferase family 4 protein [Bacteroidota bacterium]
MNILILHGSSDLYGASKILLVTARMLRKQGHMPIVVLSGPGPLAAELEKEGIEVLFVQLGILRRKYKSIPGILNRLCVLRKAFNTIRQLIRDKNIQVVYSNTTAVIVGAFAAKATHTRHVWHVHEIIEKPRWVAWFLGKLVNRYSTAVIVVSQAVAQNWGRYVAAHKLKRVYNGIDYAPYQHPSNQLRTELALPPHTLIVGMVGRVHHWKGQDYFLQIAAELAKQVSSIHFVMIGDVFPGYEYLYEKLSTQKKEAGLESLVTDMGYRTDVPALLQGFDIFVLPSILPDPFPTVILEAMASGKPVVATRHGGALEMVDEGRTGILIPVNDARSAADLMQPWILDPLQRSAMGEAGRQRVLTHFSLEAFEAEMIKVLE